MRRTILPLTLILVWTARAWGQEPKDAGLMDRVLLKSQRELSGTLISDHGGRLWFEDHELGPVVVERTKVRALRLAGIPPDLYTSEAEELKPEEAPATYVRFVKGDKETPGTLDTGVSRWYHAETRTTLFLVGAVHIADRPYFERLQEVLDACDVVLFEGVGRDKDGREPSKEDLERLDTLRQFQLAMGEALGLDHQHAGMDYRRSFWKNADVDFMTLSEEMKARKVELPTDNALFRFLVKTVLGLVKPEMISKNPALAARIRRQMASILGNSDRLMKSLGKVQEVLIDYRNEVAFKSVATELEGPPGRHLALFYGAAHLPDFNVRLAAKGFTCVGSGWISAWTF